MRKFTLLSSLILLFACNQEDRCSDEFVLDYQRMGDAFERLYKPNAGSFEVKTFDDSLSRFLSNHKDVECKYEGTQLSPTKEVEAVRRKLATILTPKGIQSKSLASLDFRLSPKVIYGEDNREQVADVAGVYQSWAGSTLAQISPKKWDQNYSFIGGTYQEELSLCPGERFSQEFSVARCSGFLVAPDVVVTAGHCMQSQLDCDNFRWVLDFHNDAKGTSASKVFECAEVLDQKLDDTNDYAVIRLNREVSGRKFFRTRTSGIVAQNTPLVMIGYPSGISAKVADGAVVRDSSARDFFVTNTDSFGGNSGSAVINRDTGVVEGILVRGDQDFDIIDGPDGGRCRIERVCPDNGCEGEEVTKMTAVKGIPLLADPEAIRAGLYSDKNFPSISDGFPISFLGYSYGGHTVGGLKFLDRCGIHYYENDKPEAWKEFHVGECAQTTDLDQVINTFGNLFYF